MPDLLVPFGFLNIDKPAGMTSHDVVAQIRRLLRRDTGSRKVGHAGTLDPMATGVLVVCLGQATRLSEYMVESAKRYRARVRLGIETDTYDADGQIVATTDPGAITRQQVEAVLMQFRGDIDQVPPMYSAIKQGGRKLYELARQGKTVERPPRSVTLYDLRLADWSPPEFTLTVTCSPGTYIRSLACDIGQALGVGAHLSALTREASGLFDLATAQSLDVLIADPDWMQHVIAPPDVMSDWYHRSLSLQEVDDLSHGRSITRQSDAPQRALAYTPDGQLLAVLEASAEFWKPRKVFSADT